MDPQKHGRSAWFHLSAWQGYEAGRLGLSLPTLLRISTALGITPSELLAQAEQEAYLLGHP